MQTSRSIKHHLIHFMKLLFKKIPALMPGSFYKDRQHTMFCPTPLHRQIAGVVLHSQKPFQPLLHLLPVDINHVQSLGTTIQLTGVLGSDNDPVQHPQILMSIPLINSACTTPSMRKTISLCTVYVSLADSASVKAVRPTNHLVEIFSKSWRFELRLMMLATI